MNKDKCCGNCAHFKNEDTTGKGWCEEQSWITECNKVCNCHHSGNNGWVEITPDNVDVMPELTVVTDKKEYKMANHWHCSISTMAKIGGYYYYVIPEFKE